MSFGAAVLTFREGLEAALILAIMLGYLRKVGRAGLKWSVWLGALLAVGSAVGFTVVLQIVGAQFDYPAKGIYEGLTSLLAVVMLTYMIFWMAKQARYIKGSLEHSMKETLVQGAGWGLFGLAFMTVAREGVETALFLSASAFQSSGWDTLVGGLAGVAVSLILAWVVYVAGVRLQMRTFFRITSLLLVIFAAAILRYAVHEFEEVAWIPPLIEHVWNTGGWLSTGSGLGAVLQALVGYTSQPSLSELLAYLGYLLVVGTLLLWPGGKKLPAQAPRTAEAALEAPGDASSPVRNSQTPTKASRQEAASTRKVSR